MKLLFSLFFLIPSIYARPIVVLSGKASTREREVIKRILVSKTGIPSLFIETDFNNHNCKIKKDSVIQLCFDHYNFKIIQQNSKVMRGTIGRVITNKKGLQAEGLGNL